MTSTKNFIIHSHGGDVWRHLAREEYLLNQFVPGQRILYIWQTQSTVVVGKHQNPWCECHPGLLRKTGVNLARRLTGGGAVYHDTGSLNFSFIVDRDSFNYSNQIQIIISALRRHGFEVDNAENHSLNFRGRKCSGNAFMFRKSKALHHGTLLLSSNIKKLNHNLRPLACSIESHAVRSNRTAVTNIGDRNHSLRCDEIGQSIGDVYSECIGSEFTVVEGARFLPDTTDLEEKYASWEWVYGRTPKFEVGLRMTLSSGTCDINMVIVDGRILKTSLDGEWIDRMHIDILASALRGCRFDSNCIAERIKESIHHDRGEKILSELAEGFSEYGI